jgi:hypothetical protein
MLPIARRCVQKRPDNNAPAEAAASFRGEQLAAGSSLTGALTPHQLFHGSHCSALTRLSTLQGGSELPDQLLVDLVLWGINQLGSAASQKLQARSCAQPSADPAMQCAARQVAAGRRPGFVLDGFPATAAQALLLHQRLTGRDLESEEQLLKHGSQLLPELGTPSVDRPAPFQSGRPRSKAA